VQDTLSSSSFTTLRALERCLVDAVCETGVDLNRCLSQDHYQGMLTFVGGLGLRKAHSLRLSIRRRLGSIQGRRELLEGKLVGKVVFTNASGFLRITDDTPDRERGLDPLDDTRIHPECYISNDFAPKICADALEVMHNAEVYVTTVLRIMENSKNELELILKDDFSWAEKYLLRHEVKELGDKLSELELEDYANDLELLGKGKRLQQLLQIKDEIRFPWLDFRTPLTEMSAEELFVCLTGETDSSLHVGLRVSCKVVEIREKSVNVLVDGGTLRGFAKIGNLSDDFVENVSAVVQMNEVKQGVILRVIKDQGRVEVSFKRSHVSTGEDWWFANRNIDEGMMEWWASAKRGELDPYFDEVKALTIYTDSRAEISSRTDMSLSRGEGAYVGGPRRSTGGVKQRVRTSQHLAFKNCTFKEAEKELTGKGAGEVLFRPSSKGGLSLTWAFQESMFKHFDIIEVGRKENDQNMAVGDQLRIKGAEKETYSSFDEIMARFIDPMNEHVTRMTEYRSFKPGLPEDVEACLKENKAKRPESIPYFIRFDMKMPGYFVLTWYVEESTTHPFKKEYVAVVPEVKR